MWSAYWGSNSKRSNSGLQVKSIATTLQTGSTVPVYFCVQTCVCVCMYVLIYTETWDLLSAVIRILPCNFSDVSNSIILHWNDFQTLLFFFLFLLFFVPSSLIFSFFFFFFLVLLIYILNIPTVTQPFTLKLNKPVAHVFVHKSSFLNPKSLANTSTLSLVLSRHRVNGTWWLCDHPTKNSWWRA